MTEKFKDFAFAADSPPPSHSIEDSEVIALQMLKQMVRFRKRAPIERPPCRRFSKPVTRMIIRTLSVLRKPSIKSIENPWITKAFSCSSTCSEGHVEALINRICNPNHPEPPWPTYIAMTKKALKIHG